MSHLAAPATATRRVNDAPHLPPHTRARARRAFAAAAFAASSVRRQQRSPHLLLRRLGEQGRGPFPDVPEHVVHARPVRRERIRRRQPPVPVEPRVRLREIALPDVEPPCGVVRRHLVAPRVQLDLRATGPRGRHRPPTAREQRAPWRGRGRSARGLSAARQPWRPRGRRAPHTPTRSPSAGACRPTCSTPSRRSTRRAPPGGPRCP